jgi:hypothetical protein
LLRFPGAIVFLHGGQTGSGWDPFGGGDSGQPVALPGEGPATGA